MRDFTCESVLDLYLFLRRNIRDLPDEQLEFLTPAECDEFRAELLEETRKDCAFKLLTLLEADPYGSPLVWLRTRTLRLRPGPSAGAPSQPSRGNRAAPKALDGAGSSSA